jgi:hypothetical protein
MTDQITRGPDPDYVLQDPLRSRELVMNAAYNVAIDYPDQEATAALMHVADRVTSPGWELYPSRDQEDDPGSTSWFSARDVLAARTLAPEDLKLPPFDGDSIGAVGVELCDPDRLLPSFTPTVIAGSETGEEDAPSDKRPRPLPHSSMSYMPARVSEDCPGVIVLPVSDFPPGDEPGGDGVIVAPSPLILPDPDFPPGDEGGDEGEPEEDDAPEGM